MAQDDAEAQKHFNMLKMDMARKRYPTAQVS